MSAGTDMQPRPFSWRSSIPCNRTDKAHKQAQSLLQMEYKLHDTNKGSRQRTNCASQSCYLHGKIPAAVGTKGAIVSFQFTKCSKWWVSSIHTLDLTTSARNWWIVKTFFPVMCSEMLEKSWSEIMTDNRSIVVTKTKS